MSVKILILVIFSLVFAIVSFASSAQMNSSSFRVSSAVVSGGGAFAGSANYQLNGSIGQPAPLMDSLDPPFSDNYDLYPGFWYTIQDAGLITKLKSMPWLLLLLSAD